ncbi:FAD-binding oxidoreductase [Glaciihabitans sp. INWT7]|uniref:FAD-binding oxidoreductase n=1 Tax=Glaciihabitans sp. INWT7 TaxID=2596912 RepID=UPI00162819C7|nr:FAD-binding oxidoreductase [Glaciihabitans sp. INWT7]QNE47999.1 FAD-binding oxidoreductase [Glaciihabitans sp. INWT7]
MGTVSRRHLFALAGVGLVASGCAPVTPNPSPSASAGGPPDWAALAGSVGGTLSRPGDATYDTVRLTENPRWDTARPLAVLSAETASDVAVAIGFAARYRVPISLRSGGHSYPGYSAGGAPGTGVKPSLVIDTRRMAQVELAADNTVRVGVGASLAALYDAIGSKGRAIAAGSCATVGIAGLTLGGGVGVLVRAYGLTCDSLVGVEIVTADGTVHSADASTDPDLFWASRGGGGGHVGVVTALTFATRPAPDVTMFSLGWHFAEASAVIRAWQDWAPTADPKLWSTLKLLNGARYPTEPGVFVSGTWIGDPSDLDGQLQSFLTAAGTPKSRGSSTHEYRDAMMIYAGCGSSPASACTTGSGGMLSRESFAGTSHVATTRLDAAGIQTVIDTVKSAKSVPGMIEGGVSLDALGGTVQDIAADATAFPHRDALMTVQYTATFTDGADPDPPSRWVRGFRTALLPQWGTAAYVNYADADIADPSASYFGANAERLEKIARQYDPNGLFTQPQPW